MKCLSRFCLLIALIAFACCTTIRAQGRSDVDGSLYEVVPSTWVTASGHGIGLATQPSAYVFPSLNPEGSANDPSAYTEPNFFGNGNHFRDKEVFVWQPEGGAPIRIEVARLPSPHGSGATISVAPGSETSIRRLTWRQFDHLQILFHHWLCRKSTFWPWESCESRFPSAPKFADNVSRFWKDTVLKSADLKAFDPSTITKATCYHCEISYKLSTADRSSDVDMYATLISPGDVLNIAWGLTVIYPQSGVRGISAGYSRPSVGGSTEINIAISPKGLSLFPQDSWNSTPESESSDQQTTDYTGAGFYNLVPFPTKFLSMMADPAQFVPINNSLDLRDRRLLRANSVGLPPFLFLLSPKSYVKPDAGILPPNPESYGTLTIAQFYSDAREVSGNLVDKPLNEVALQFSRRFILVGCDQPDEACVAGQLQALQCQALAAFNTPCFTPMGIPAFAMGVFPNQTFIEIRHHVSINGRPLPITVLDQQTWDSVVAGWSTSLLDRDGKPGSAPLVRVRRTIRSNLGVDKRVTILLHTTSSQALGAMQVFEGDEFYVKADL